MGCKYETELDLGCTGYTVGGVNRVIIGNRVDISAYVVNVTTNVLEAWTMAASTYLYEIPIKEFSAGATSELQGGDIGNQGGTNWLHQVTFSVPAISQEFLNAMEDLGLSRVVVFVESRTPDTTGVYNRVFVFGRLNGMKATALLSGLGQAVSDLAGSTVTMQGYEIEIMKELVPAAGTPIAYLEALFPPPPGP